MFRNNLGLAFWIMCAYPKIKDKVEPDGNNLLLESISCKRDALVKVLVNNLIYINSG